MKTKDYLDQKFSGTKPRYCWMCKCQLNRLTATVDHLQPKSKGGRNTETNFKVACKPCNTKRGNRSIPHRLALELKGMAPAKKRDHAKLAAAIRRAHEQKVKA